jgi:hypothetical protein
MAEAVRFNRVAASHTPILEHGFGDNESQGS